jgi:hypothetical protein
MPFEGFPTTLPEFERRFADEVACTNYLRSVKWQRRDSVARSAAAAGPTGSATRPRAVRRVPSLGHFRDDVPPARGASTVSSTISSLPVCLRS